MLGTLDHHGYTKVKPIYRKYFLVLFCFAFLNIIVKVINDIPPYTISEFAFQPALLFSNSPPPPPPPLSLHPLSAPVCPLL